MKVVLFFLTLIFIVFIVFVVVSGVYFFTTANKSNNAMKMKMCNVWNWLTSGGGRPLSSSTNKNKVSGERQNSSEIIIQQIERIDADVKNRLSTIEKTLIDILYQQKSIKEEQERIQQVCPSLSSQQDRQMAILRELKTAMDTLSLPNQRREVETTISNGTYGMHSFKELYCRQLSEGKDGFYVNDLTDSPNSNCYIIKQYDETHAILNIVEDPLVRSQMITSYTDFISPVCDFDGQSPAGKDGFEVKETGELEFYSEKWLIKKKMKIQFF